MLQAHLHLAERALLLGSVILLDQRVLYADLLARRDDRSEIGKALAAVADGLGIRALELLEVNVLQSLAADALDVLHGRASRNLDPTGVQNEMPRGATLDHQIVNTAIRIGKCLKLKRVVVVTEMQTRSLDLLDGLLQSRKEALKSCQRAAELAGHRAKADDGATEDLVLLDELVRVSDDAIEGADRKSVV